MGKPFSTRQIKAARRSDATGAHTLTFDPVAMRLTGPGLSTPLTGLPCRILERLIATPGAVVTRAELKAAFWPGSQRIDTERRLNTAMRALRRALDACGGDGDWIETLRNVGYRWTGPSAGALAPGAPRAAPKLRSWNGRKPAAPWRGPAFAAAAIAGACALLIGLTPSPRSTRLSPAGTVEFIEIAAQSDRAPDAARARLDSLIARNPRYGPALVLAARMAAANWRARPDGRRLSSAEAALSRAEASVGRTTPLELIRADLSLHGEWDLGAAERAYRGVLARDPADAEARRGLAWLLLDDGRAAQAAQQVDAVLASGAVSDESRADLGWLLLRLRRPELAARLCEGPSTSPNLIACRHTAFAGLGRWADARAGAVAFMRLARASERAVENIRGGDPRPAYSRFLAWRAQALVAHSGWFQKAQLLAGAGDRDLALASLETALRLRDPNLVKLGSTLEFDSLHGDARFGRLIRQFAAARRS